MSPQFSFNYSIYKSLFATQAATRQTDRQKEYA